MIGCKLSPIAVESALNRGGERFLNYILRVFIPYYEKNHLPFEPYGVLIVCLAWDRYLREIHQSISVPALTSISDSDSDSEESEEEEESESESGPVPGQNEGTSIGLVFMH